MVNWDTQTRGQNRQNEDSYYHNKTDWDGKSCADFHQLPGRGIRDVENLTLLSGLQHYDNDEGE